MPKHNHETSESRRRFLRTSLVTSASVAAAAVAGEAVASTADPATSDAKADDKGYRLTQHVADYYRTAAL